VTLQDTIEKKDGLIIKTTWANVNGESQPTLIKKTAVTDNLTTNDLPSAKLTHKNGSGLTSEEKTSISLKEILEKPASSKPSLTQEFSQQLFEHTESNLGEIAKQDKQIGMSDETLSTESQNDETKEHHLPRTADAPQTHLTLLGLGLASLATYLKKRKED
ncbi:LPXTG cell wall anchor domain-containing protein, partial [Streptococcus fryi]